MKAARQLSIAILVILACTAFYISYHLITDATGSSLGFPTYLLNGTVFNNYAVVGWIMLFTVGLFSITVVGCIIRKMRIYSFLIMLQGVIITIFIFLAMILLDEIFLVQYLFLAAGIILISLGFLQNQRKIIVESEKQMHQPAQKSHHHKHRKHK